MTMIMIKNAPSLSIHCFTIEHRNLMLALNVYLGGMNVNIIWTYIFGIGNSFHSLCQVDFILKICSPTVCQEACIVSLSIQSMHSSYKNELATVLIVTVSDNFFFPFDDLGEFPPPSNYRCTSNHFHSYHPHNSSLCLPVFHSHIVSRSHFAELLVTGANLFSTCPTFQSCISLIETRQTENTLHVC